METRILLSASIYDDENDKENQGTVGPVEDPGAIGGITNPFGTGPDVDEGGQPVGKSGAVVIDGGDREEHGDASAGADGTLGTADDINNDGWLYIEQLVDFGMRGSLNNAPNDVLVIGATDSGFGFGALAAITSVTTVLGLSQTVITGGEILTTNFNDYKLIWVPSNGLNTFGGITEGDLALLESRRVDIQNFVNNGGSVNAFTEAFSANPYGWLQLPDPFIISTNVNGVDDLFKTQAAIDAGLTITDQELSNGVPYHNEFIGPPGFNGLKPFVISASGEIVAIGLASGSFGIGDISVEGDDHGQSPNHATIVPIGATQTGEITFDGDADFFRVHLSAGQTYIFETKLGTLGDTTMSLLAPDGKTVLAYDDDGGLGRASRIIFTPQTGGTYYLNVRPFNYQDRGTYSLEIRKAQIAPISAPTLIAPLTSTVDDTPNFEWTAVAGASSYELVVHDITSGEQNVIHVVVNSTSYAPAVALDLGHSYSWKVRAVSPMGGTSSYTNLAYFNIPGGLDDHDNVPADATDIVPGAWQGNIDYLGDEDWFRINTVPGTTYVIQTTGGTRAYLYDNTVATISDSIGSTLTTGIDGRLIDNVVDGTLNLALTNLDLAVDISNGASLSNGTIIQIGAELMEITGGAGNNRTVTRGFGGTAAAAHLAGDDVIVRSIRVDDPTAFKSTTPFSIRIGGEQMLVTAIGAGVDADRFLVTRGTGGTTASNHFVNNTVLQLGTVTFNVANVAGFPAAPGFTVQIDNERFLVTAINGDEFTATRGADNTTPARHNAGANVSLQVFGGLSTLQFTATNKGPYFIQIRNPFGGTGAYTMTVGGLAGDTHGDTPGTAFPIALNQTVEASIESHRDEDWFVFTAPHDGHFIFETVLGSLLDSTLQLYDTAGTTLLQSDNDSGVGRASKIERDMLTGQTIRLRAQGFDLRIGTYAIKVGELPADDHLNNSLNPAGLTQLLLNNPVFGNGSIEVPGDQDWFKIDVVAGQKFILETVSGTLNDTTMTLYAADGTTQLAFDDDGGPGKLSRITYTPTVTGTFFVRVKAFSALVTGTYQVTYTAGTADDFGNNAAAAALILADTSTPGNIETGGDQDWFKFDAAAGQDYVFETVLGSLNDTVLTLFDTDGATVIATNDDGGIGLASRITWQPAVNGTYFLKVAAYGQYQVGTYHLTISATVDDHGDSAADPTGVLVNSSTGGNIERAQDQDWFTVDLVQNTFYRFEIQTDSLSAARFRLIDQNGLTVLKYTETSQGHLLGSNVIEFLAPATGTYFLKVQGLGSFDTGTFTVNVVEPLVSGVGTPILLSPKGIVTSTRFPLFAWQPASLAERYVLQVDNLTTGQQAVILQTSLTGTTFTPTSPLQNGHVYRWSVQAFNDTNGTAGLPSLGQNFLMQLADDHADKSVGSTPIPTNGSVSGDLEIPGDQDWFNFKAKEGADYIIDVTLNTLADSTLELVDKNGTTVLAFDDDGGPGLASRINWHANATGTYFLRVTPKTSGMTGTYSVSVTESIDDHGDVPVDATFVLSPSITAGNIELGGDVDVFRVLAVKGVTYNFSTLLGSIAGTNMTLFAANGVTIISQDTNGGTASIDFTATSTGSVFLAVSGAGANQTGTYNVRVTSSADDHGNNAPASTPISVGLIIDGNIESFGDQDWFSIALTADNNYTFATALLTLPDSVLTLYDINGTTIISTDDDGGIGLASLIEFTPTVDGTYFLKVTAFDTTQVGTYTLSVTEQAAPKLTVGNNVNVSAMPFNQAEVTIAVNTVNPLNLIAASNTLDDTAANDVIWYSNDAGQTWTLVQIPNSGGSTPFGDPTVVFDRTGVAYYAHLSTNGIEVARSTNGGQTWTVATVPTPAGFPDKEFFGIGPDVNDLSQDRLYLAYHIGNEQFINSSSDGVNWSAPVLVSDGTFGINGQVAVDGNGRVYMAWQEINFATPGISRIFVDVSNDGGLTWGSDIVAYTSNVAPFNDPFTSGQYTVPGAPDRGIGAYLSMDVDRSGGANDGNVYMVVVDQADLDGSPDAANAADHHDTDIFLLRSTNGGTSWSGPVRVNDDTTANSQFIPWMDVDQTTGNLAIGWYDARNDDGLGGTGDTDAVANTDMQFFVTASLDGGLTFMPNVQVSTGTSNQSGAEPYPAIFNNFDYGEYAGIAFHNNVIHAAWSDNSNSTGDNPGGVLGTQDVYYASITLSGGGFTPLPPPGGSGFDITVNFADNSLTPAQQALILSTLGRWEELIIGDVEDVMVGLTLVDDISIDVFASFIDGVGGILGGAAPLTFRSGASANPFLPSSGVIQLDVADINDPGIIDVILHEIGHTLGFGTIWDDLGLLSGSGTFDPRFTGVLATAEYNARFGVNEAGIPLETLGGPGTAESHWSEFIFFNELMTGFLDPGFNAVSRITVAQFEDLGYQVDYSTADAYVVSKLFASLSAPVNISGLTFAYSPVTLDAGTLNVRGSSLDDVITVSLGADVVINMNGTEYVYNAADVQHVTLDGLTGADVLNVTGTSGNDSVTLRPDSLELVGAGITVSGRSFASISVSSGGGQDVAFLYDSAGNDVYTASPTNAKMEGAGYLNQVNGFRKVYAYSYAGGVDTARLYDSAGNDNFVGQEARSWLSGTGYYNSASRFDRVDAYTSAGYDVAMMWDGAGNDQFQVDAHNGSLSGTGFDNRAHNFDRVYGYAYGGGIDEAKMFDSAGDDRFVGKDVRSTLFGDNYYASASRFERVFAVANNGGTDRADLYGNNGNDVVAAAVNESTMTGNGYFYSAAMFEAVNAYAGAGGTDLSSITDSSGNDVFLNTADASYMTWSAGRKISVFNFNSVDAKAIFGGNDTAEFRTLNALDSIFGLDDLAQIGRSSGKSAKATGFDNVIAQSLSAAGPSTDLTSLDFVFSKTGAWN
ncbi:MAG: pre-peptidase C-terminal domain-containing protein [Planctomycetaceae bacterium]